MGKCAISVCYMSQGEPYFLGYSAHRTSHRQHFPSLHLPAGKFDEAEAFARRAVESLRTGVGRSDVSTATALYNLAGLAKRQGKFGDAEAAKRAKNMAEKQQGGGSNGVNVVGGAAALAV